MQCVSLNGHKIYNVTVGKSLPEWLSDQKKRRLQQKDLDIRRRIELIQDFEMPILSTNIRVSKNQQYIMATGVYKPRVRCFDVNQKSMKFDRCMDAEAETFQIISDDYTKMVFLQNDRFVDFHNQAGFMYRTRIPMYGRDFDCLKTKAELFFVGRSNEIVRMNLEKGMFMNPIKTDAEEILCCQMNDRHEFLMCGTNDGRLESFDHRTRRRINGLNCRPLLGLSPSSGVAGITSIKYSSDLSLAVGTSTGQILMFDIRSNKPLIVKDHMFGLPIKSLAFSKTETNHDVVLSGDSRIIKIWEKDTGKPYTSIQSELKMNDVCLFPNSGMVFIANESPKILVYFIPDLGPAPSWCSKLTGMTEELEEDPEPLIYDNFKFLTRAEVESLGLSHLIGTDALRAEMHGYFVDMKFYLQAKQIAQPYDYNAYKKKQTAKKNEPKSRIVVDKSNLPDVNKKLAERLMMDEKSKIQKDSRFLELFDNEDFEIDEECDEFRLQMPHQMKLEKKRKKLEEEEAETTEENRTTVGTAKNYYNDEDSDDDEFKQELKKQYRLINEAKRQKEKTTKKEKSEDKSRKRPWKK